MAQASAQQGGLTNGTVNCTVTLTRHAPPQDKGLISWDKPIASSAQPPSSQSAALTPVQPDHAQLSPQTGAKAAAPVQAETSQLAAAATALTTAAPAQPSPALHALAALQPHGAKSQHTPVSRQATPPAAWPAQHDQQQVTAAAQHLDATPGQPESRKPSPVLPVFRQPSPAGPLSGEAQAGQRRSSADGGKSQPVGTPAQVLPAAGKQTPPLPAAAVTPPPLFKTTSIDAFMHDLLVSTGSLTGPSTSKPPLAPAQHAAAPGLTMDAIFQEIMANRMANKAPLANASPLRNDSSFSTALLLSQGSMLSHQPSFLGGLSHQGSFFGLNHQGSLDKLMRATSIDKVLAELHVPSLHGGQSDKEWASAYNNLAGAVHHTNTHPAGQGQDSSVAAAALASANAAHNNTTAPFPAGAPGLPAAPDRAGHARLAAAGGNDTSQPTPAGAATAAPEPMSMHIKKRKAIECFEDELQMQASGGALKQAGEMPNQLSAILEQEHSHDDMDGDGKRKSDDGAIGSGSGQSRPPRPPVHRRSSINSLTAEDISLNLDALGGLHDFPRSSHSVGRPSREQELQHDVALLVGQNHALMQRLQQLAHQAEAAARENTSLKQLLTCLEPSPALLGSHPSLAALLTLKRANSSMPTRHSSGVSGGMSGGNASNASASGLYDEPSSGSGLGLVSTKRKRSAVSGQRGRPKASTVAPVFGRGSAVATAASGMVSAARNLPGGVANGYSGAVPASLGPPAGSMSSLSDLEAARVAAAALAANKGDACAALTQLLGLVGNRR